MPFVNVRTAKGLLTADQKRELHSRIAEVMVEVEGLGNPEFLNYVSILIEECEPDAWSVHGTALTADAIAQIRENLGGTQAPGSDRDADRRGAS